MFEKRLMQQVWLDKFARLAFLFTILLASLGGGMVIFQARLLSQVIQQVFLENKTTAQLTTILTWLLGVFLCRFFFSWGKEWCAERYTTHVKVKIRNMLFSHISQDVHQESSGEVINTLIEGIEAVDAYYRELLPQLWIAVLNPLLIAWIVFYYDPLSALIFVLTAPFIPLFMVLIGKAASVLTERQWVALSRMSVYYLDILQGLTTLKIFNRSRQQAHLIGELGEQHQLVTMSVLRVAFLSALTMELLSTISTALVAVGVGLRLLYGYITFENALFVLFLAPEFYLPLRLLGQKFHTGITAISAAKRIFEILDQPSWEGLIPCSTFKTIRFQQVCYHYPQEQVAAVEGLSFEIPKGKLIALVGESGAGKSTIVRLLLGFFQPDAGALLIDDMPLSKIELTSWRKQITWVSQNPYLFNDTVFENIRFAAPQASNVEVVQAAQLAHAYNFIMELPQGFDTQIGERGVRLSVGEAQRLALARAFLKQDSLLVIVDEASSALDVESELFIQQALITLSQHKTVFIVAHRLATVYRADNILVLSRGKLVQWGTHEQLVAKDGTYRDLVFAHQEKPVQVKRSVLDLAVCGNAQVSPNFLLFDMSAEIETAQQVPLGLDAKPKENYLAALFKPIVFSILLGTLTVISGIGLMSAAAFIISAAALQPSIAELNVAIVGVRFFGIMRGVFRYFERIVSHQATLKLLTRLRVWFYLTLEPLVPAKLIMMKTADVFERINADITSLDQFYLRVAFPPFVALLVTIGMSFFLIHYSYNLVGLLWVSMLMAGVITPFLIYRMSRVPSQETIIKRNALTVGVFDFVQGLADVLAFNAEERMLSHLVKLNQLWVNAQTKMAALSGLQNALTTLWANLTIYAALLISIPLVNAHLIQGVFLALIVMALLASFEVITPLPLAAQYFEAHREAAQRLLDIVNTQPLVDIKNPIRLFPLERLSFKNISFRYPYNERKVLENISFTLTKCNKIAIVGSSGAGKSTILNLMLRFWEYQEGDILWNGQSLRHYAQAELRQCLAVMSQRVTLFNTTIMDHFRLANATASEDEIFQICEAVQIHARICSLGQGYHTVVGEGGWRLSAGERQRLALAMALLHPASLLVLDEPTANLDTLTEKAIMQSIHPFITNRTVLLITHRLVGLEEMDEIIVLNKGRVVERGNHDDLLKGAGIYSRMLTLQNQFLDKSKDKNFIR